MIWKRCILPALLLVLLAHSRPAAAAELNIGYRAIEKALLSEVFVDGGRKFLLGSPQTPCAQAFLASPAVSPQGERLQIRARFHSQAGVEISGECVGAGDTFDVWMSGVPAYRDGVLFLDQIRVQTPDKPYGDLARNLLGQTLPRLLRYPLLDEVRQKAAENSRQGPYQVAVARLDVGRITLAADHLSIPFDFTLSLH